MIKYVILLGIASSLLACAATPADAPEHRLPTDAEVEQYNTQVAAEDRIVCRQEIPVGTNIPQRICRLVVDVEETSDFHREQLRNVLR